MDNKHCRFCGSELKHTMVDLGLSPLSNDYVAKDDLDRGQYYYPLHVMVCELFLFPRKLLRPQCLFVGHLGHTC